MEREALIVRIYHCYKEGFRGMRLGRTLWWIILIKLFVMFFILRLFFFPDFLGRLDNDRERGDYVSNELIRRAINP